MAIEIRQMIVKANVYNGQELSENVQKPGIDALSEVGTSCPQDVSQSEHIEIIKSQIISECKQFMRELIKEQSER